MSQVLRSSLLDGLGVRHGFGPCGDLRAGEAADERGRFLAEAGLDPDAVFEASQVHGAAVCEVRPGDDLAAVRAVDADVLVARDGAAVAVRVADCVSVLVCDPDTGGVAAVHAGWRGTTRGVLPAAIEALAGGTARPERFAAAMFPHIRACCFEVGDDVAEEIQRAAAGSDVVVRGGAKPHVDLARVVRDQLERAGLGADRIDDVGGCTRCEPERFYSYRRDGAAAGRHLAAIMAR